MIQFRHYVNDTRFGVDYYKLRRFLLRLDSSDYTFGRWDWMITHSYLDESGLGKIGLWENDGELVAIATYDCSLGDAYPMTLPGWESLTEATLEYAMDALSSNKKSNVMIRDGDLLTQSIAMKRGLIPTQQKECNAIYIVDDPNAISYTVPEGFSIVSLAEHYDAFKIGQVFWKGFDHEIKGEGLYQYDEKKRLNCDSQMFRPHVNLTLKIAAIAPNGDFASFCGMWQDDACPSALLEPLATDPAYRKMGLGRVVVLEAIKRCGMLGAKRVYVGSNQQFYYSIGFRPYSTYTAWALKKKD